MFNIFKKYHIIKHFPKNYPFYKKLYANILYFLTGIIIHPRKNLLSRKDILKTRLKLRRGDVVLLGNLRESSALILDSPLTHATLYIGFKKFIEATGDGVHYSSLHHILTTYDTLVILRVPKKTRKRRKIIRSAIQIAKQQLGKPYDFDYSPGDDTIFCTELVNIAYRKAGYKTGIATFGHFKSVLDKIQKIISTAPKALRPERFIQGNFEIIFASHNLKIKGKRVKLNKSL